MQSNIHVKIIRTIKDIESIRIIWESLQYHPNSDIDFFLMILETNKEYLHPHIIVIYRDAIPVAMLVGRIEERQIEIKVGYLPIYKPTARLLTVIYSGILGEQTQDIAAIIFNELKKTQLNQRVDAILFSHIKTDSPLFRMIISVPFMYRDHFPSSNLHWRMNMANSVNEILQKIKSKHRAWMRRIVRKLEEDHPGQVIFKSLHKVEDVKVLSVDAEAISKLTYQRSLGAGFILNNANLSQIEFLSQKGWLRGYILYVANKPCAYWIGTFYKNLFLLNSTGYDPAYRKYEIGTILFLKMLEDLCSSGDIQELDFGFGDAFYKERFGDKYWEEASVYIYTSSFASIKLNFARTFASLVSKSAEKVLSKFNARDKIKKIWRDKLSASLAQQGRDNKK